MNVSSLRARPPRWVQPRTVQGAVLLTLLAAALLGCTDEDDKSLDCSDITRAVDPEELPCADRVDLVRVRVARNGFGSAVVWSRRTDDGYALLVSAVHVLGQGWFGPVGTDVSDGFVEPETRGVLRLGIPSPDGDRELATYTPLYSLYHLEIPKAENEVGLRNILPRHDVFLGLADAFRAAYDGQGPFPGTPPRSPGRVELFDPGDHTLTPPMWTTSEPGTLLLLLGYPQDTAAFPRGAASLARVLSDQEAAERIAELAALGDEEGTIAYEPEAEVLLEGDALVGMSGGGAFDANGRWVGTLVRASAVHDGVRLVRVVRASYLATRVRAAFAALDEEGRATFAPFLDPALQQPDD